MSDPASLVPIPLRQAEIYLRAAAQSSSTHGAQLAYIDLAEMAIDRAHIALRNEHPAEYAAWVAAGRPRS